jgi:signal transduction histidine kinase
VSTLISVLHDFISTHRADILARTRSKVAARPAPAATRDELENGIPLFLDQLITSLRSSSSDAGLAASAARHGALLERSGFTVAQVVHDYGGVCQAVTELADETNAMITADEFRVFNRCLDDAIAQAVTEHSHRREQSISAGEREHLGVFAHELRNAVQSANVAFEVLRLGKVGLDGSTSGVLRRSLHRLTSLVDQSLTQVRLESGIQSPEVVSVRNLLVEIAAGASMQANARSIAFDVEPGDTDVDVHVDRQLVTAAIGNLLHNAFKFTRLHGHVSLRASATDRRVLLDVQDGCGGLPPGSAAELFRPFEQRGSNRSGLGLGLSITRKSIEASGGSVRVRDIPGSGCVFTIELPQFVSA